MRKRELLTYYIAETDPNGRVNATGVWREVQTATLDAAKRAASRFQKFQHTTMRVGVLRKGAGIVAVTEKKPVLIHRAAAASWTNLDAKCRTTWLRK